MIIYLQMIESDEDKSKFEQLYIMYKGLMFHVAMKILKNEFDAEDAVHQAFLSLIENLKKISDVKCPKTRAYIVIITERKAIDIIRSRSKLVDMEFWESTYGIEIPLPGDHGLADAMARLPAAYRDILLLRYYNGYSVREISSMLHQGIFNRKHFFSGIVGIYAKTIIAVLIAIYQRKSVRYPRRLITDVIYFIIFAIEKIDRYALVDFFYPLEGALSCLYINCQPCADRQNRHN